MKLPRNILHALKNKNGYTMMAVLCVLLVFLVLGANALVAAHAAVGTTAKKQNDTQAYALANSALTRVSSMIEAGNFSDFIKSNVMNSITAGKPVATPATAVAEFILPEQSEPAQIRVTFTMSNITIMPPPPGSTTPITTGLLTAQITAVYRASEYSFFADYQQLIDPGNPTNTRWKLRTFRNDRFMPEPQAEEKGSG